MKTNSKKTDVLDYNASLEEDLKAAEITAFELGVYLSILCSPVPVLINAFQTGVSLIRIH